jgi:hypothetical protein
LLWAASGGRERGMEGWGVGRGGGGTSAASSLAFTAAIAFCSLLLAFCSLLLALLLARSCAWICAFERPVCTQNSLAPSDVFGTQGNH